MPSMRELSWRPIFLYLIVVVVVMVTATVILWFQISGVFHTQYENALIAQVQGATQQQALIDAWMSDGESLEAMLHQIRDATGSEIAAYAPDGTPLADAMSVDESMGEQSQSPELRSALNGRVGVGRRGNPAGEQTYYVATPVHDDDTLVGAVLFAFSASDTETRFTRLIQLLVIVLVVATCVIIAVFLLQARRTSRGLQMLTSMVERIANGDLGARVLTLHEGDVGQLALSLNRMADRLQSQTRKRRREKDRLNTVLQTMNDGIVILARNGEVRSMNPAAARILDVSLRKSRHKSFVQVARDYRIAEVWKRCQKSEEEQSATIVLANDTSVHVVITPFLKRRARGYLVMIQDLTQLRHLQTVRQDFVSNVSHELRTPLASLRALVETLRDGALDDPPAAARFLDRMEVEVDALTQMVQELMELSRIESGQVPLDLAPVAPRDLIVPAVERLRMQAERVKIDLVVEVADDLPLVLADVERAQQVITNLVHNAIKYTPIDGRVSVLAENAGKQIRFTVRDSGIGISAEDLERVFERFYKADPSRSFGGAGLGLSIASHVVQAHGGEIWADSVEGEWSEFGFSLPIAEPPADANDLAAIEDEIGQPQPEASDVAPDETQDTKL